MIKKPKDSLVDAMNGFAEKLIAASTTSSVSGQVEVFSAVTKWIAVKNRLNVTDEADGSKINAYRDALADTPAAGAVHRTHGANHPARNQFRDKAIRDKANVRSITRQGFARPSDDAAGGVTLDAIKQRLPDTNGGDALDDRDAPGGAIHPAAGRRGRIRSGAVGPGDGELDGSGGEPGL